jgi:hypothetical protein
MSNELHTTPAWSVVPGWRFGYAKGRLVDDECAYDLARAVVSLHGITDPVKPDVLSAGYRLSLEHLRNALSLRLQELSRSMPTGHVPQVEVGAYRFSLDYQSCSTLVVFKAGEVVA